MRSGANTIIMLMGCVLTRYGAGALAGPEPDPQLTPVFVSGTDGYHTYRIPALLVTKAGTLLAFCEGRKNSRSARFAACPRGINR